MDKSELKVATPCTMPWDAMEGAGPTRMCGTCNRVVHDLSQGTEADARRIADRGSACVRYRVDAGGRVQFRRARRAGWAAGLWLLVSAARAEPLSQNEGTSVESRLEQAHAAASRATQVVAKLRAKMAAKISIERVRAAELRAKAAAERRAMEHAQAEQAAQRTYEADPSMIQGGIGDHGASWTPQTPLDEQLKQARSPRERRRLLDELIAAEEENVLWWKRELENALPEARIRWLEKQDATRERLEQYQRDLRGLPDER